MPEIIKKRNQFPRKTNRQTDDINISSIPIFSRTKKNGFGNWNLHDLKTFRYRN